MVISGNGKLDDPVGNWHDRPFHLDGIPDPPCQGRLQGLQQTYDPLHAGLCCLLRTHRVLRWPFLVPSIPVLFYFLPDTVYVRWYHTPVHHAPLAEMDGTRRLL